MSEEATEPASIQTIFFARITTDRPRQWSAWLGGSLTDARTAVSIKPIRDEVLESAQGSPEHATALEYLAAVARLLKIVRALMWSDEAAMDAA